MALVTSDKDTTNKGYRPWLTGLPEVSVSTRIKVVTNQDYGENQNRKARH